MGSSIAPRSPSGATNAKEATMTESEHDALIVGAGLSGLAMAHYCAGRGLTTLLLEKASRAGGCVHTDRFGAELNGFWLELGAHTCYNSYGNLLKILEDIGILGQLLKRERVSFRVRANQRLRSILSQLNIPELMLSLPRMLTQKKAGRSVEDYYGKVVGRRNFARLFSPAFDAVLCQPASEFPADMLFRPRPRRKDVLRSFTFEGGLQTIAERIAAQHGIELRTGDAVREINWTGERFVVTSEGGQHYRARLLCLATQAPAAAELLSASFPEIADPLNRIRTVTVESLAVAVAQDRLRLAPIAGIIGVDQSFYSAVSRDTVRHPKYRGFTFHFRPATLGRDEQLECVCETLGIRGSDLAAVAARTNLLPSPGLGHDALLRRIDAALEGRPLLLTGNYFSGISIEDCVTRSRTELRRVQGAMKSGTGP
jgi:oxygen-dependent protoporphyrinogen oxidase